MTSKIVEVLHQITAVAFEEWVLHERLYFALL